MWRYRPWTLAAVLLISVLMIISLPFANSSDATVDKEIRVSNIEPIGVICNDTLDCHRPFNCVLSPVIDRNNDLHYLVLTYVSNDSTVELRLTHVLKRFQGGFENSTVDEWNVSRESFDPGLWESYNIHLILSPNGTPHAIYQIGNYEVANSSRCASFLNGAWLTQQLGISVAQLVDGDNVVVADDLGRLHMLYFDFNAEYDPSTGTVPLKYMNNVGGDWNTYTISRTNWGVGPSLFNIDIDAQGQIAVFYLDQNWNLVQASYDNGMWRTGILVEGPDDKERFPMNQVVYARMDLEGHRHIYKYFYETLNGPDACTYMSDATGVWKNVTIPLSGSDELTSPGKSYGNGVIVVSNHQYVDSGGIQYEFINHYRAYRFNGLTWEVLDLNNQLYYSSFSGRPIFGVDASVNAVSDHYWITYSDAWAQSTTFSPMDLKAIPGDRTVALSWNGMDEPEVLGYRVYRKDPFVNSYTVIADTVNTSFIDDRPETDEDYWDNVLRVINGQEYTYAVTALTIDGESSPSNFVKIRPCTVPSPPENLFAFDDGNSVALIWSHPSNDGGSAVTGYNVSCEDEDGAFLWNRSLGNVTVLDTDTFVPGERYIFRVTAINAAGTGGRTAMEFITPEEVGEPYYVLSQSSSTSNVRFDNDSRSITFAVSGSDGSLGLSFVVIPKDLVDNSSDLRATLDGSELPITVQETDTAYVITMTYHHSTHEVVVYWGEDGDSSYLLLVTIGLVAVVSTIGLIILIRRRKKV